MLAALDPSHHAAGMPASNSQMYCPSRVNATSCYYLNTTTAAFSTHKSNCAAMGGYLIAYNDAFEQLDVERYFTAAGSMITSDNIWIGVAKSGNLWYWPDGRQGRALAALKSWTQSWPARPPAMRAACLHACLHVQCITIVTSPSANMHSLAPSVCRLLCMRDHAPRCWMSMAMLLAMLRMMLSF